MNKSIITALCICIFSFSQISIANATLESRLGGQSFYDTDLNITWASDANINGKHNWFEQTNWASNLTIDGVGSWRLPSVEEMEHLFNTEGVSFFTQDPFTNIQGHLYWSSTEIGLNDAGFFFFLIGGKGETPKADEMFAWPVHDGDVALIPEPEMYGMMLLGLLVLSGFARLKYQR